MFTGGYGNGTAPARALEVSAIGLGCALLYGEPDPASAIDTIRRAAELGTDFLDTSDAHAGRNEEVISRAVDGRRHDYVIATKFGKLRRPDGTPTADGRPEYVKEACGHSLQRLRTDVSGSITSTASIRRCWSRIRSARWPISFAPGRCVFSDPGSEPADDPTRACDIPDVGADRVFLVDA
jgi:hypothetical protein